MFNVNVQITGKKGMSDLSIPKAISAWESEVGPALLAEIRRRTPVSSAEGGGRLRDSITMSRGRSAGGITARFTSSAPYARFVEEGTGPHRIEPRTARALHWANKGESVFASGVNHPGTKANPFVRGAITALLPMMRQKLRERTEEEFQR
jgi:HK97 gp10 family phage protein